MEQPPLLSAAASMISPPPVAGSSGPGSIVFGSGVPDPALYPRESLEREIVRVLRDPRVDLGYSRGIGQPALCAAVADRLNLRSGSALIGEDVAVTGGASGALIAVAAAVLDPGDVVVCERYTYPAAVETFRHRGAEVVGVPTDADGPDVAAIEATLGELAARGARAKALYTIAPFQSPTTATLSTERAAALVALAERHDLLVLVDDTYGEIAFGERSPLPTVLMTSPRVVHLGSFSKTLAPALRLGWVAGNRSVVEAIGAMRTDLGVALIVQEAVARLIGSGEYATTVAAASAHYLRKRDVLMEVLDAGCGGAATWRVPEGSFFLWLETEPPVERIAAAAQDLGVGFIPGAVFAVDGADRHHLRLAFGFVGLGTLAEGADRIARSVVHAGRGAVGVTR
ncbi:PLP-dependent aminotransferase family protein [Pseudonocardia ailaonensis]|uniref:PLP-dependent aminotransferase family protein n=1 Tax=Pseudonocardia ailaonensis TaxID=367279 RepID=A0ABN2MI10_9PSEU